ncbi:MAG: ribose 5-phosphate isomerase B [Alphaproteobacteria bacterium]|nr:ribose 5-phosphate isomerase B [Alphaproteobacteria bacterium]
MKIAIAADHGGYGLKQALMAYYHNKNQDIKLEDLGTYSEESCDYPDVVKPVVAEVLNKQCDFGILICGTGVGISIAANRYKGIRAALVYNEFVAQVVKEHNNANILVFGGRTMTLEEVVRYIEIFNATSFEGGRHNRRIEKLDKI